MQDVTTSLVEVERKYDVPDDLEVPDLSGLPGVARVDRDTVSLDATYFDTEELALRTAGITLRLRRGGADAGWHLKLPHGADREEVHLPAGHPTGEPPAQVPAELQALVRSRTRRRALVPVATLRTTRSLHRLLDAEGRLLVEVADDAVQGQALLDEAPRLDWREWEVELGEGPRSLLDDAQEHLLAAGATAATSSSKVGRVLSAGREPRAWWASRTPSSQKATAGGVLRAHLAEQVEELLTRDPQVRRDRPDALHKMRVATRRLRSALRSFRPLLDRGVADPLREELAWLAGVLGEVRDTEVMHARLRGLVADQEPATVVGPVGSRIDVVLEDRYRAAHDRVLVELEGERYLELLDRLDALVDAPPLVGAAKKKAAGVLPGLVRQADQRLDRAMTAAERASGEEQDLLLHEARKDAKRARYAAEAVAGFAGKPARTYAKAITRLQEVLGEHQDGVVTREVLRELADAAEQAGESSFTYGRLHGLEQARAEAAAARWPQVHAEAGSRGLRRWLRRG